MGGSFFQNPTAGLYVSAEGGLSGASAPATSPTLAKFLRAHPFQLRRPGRPAKGSYKFDIFLIDGQRIVGGVILPQGCERGVGARISAGEG